eukprot:scaffold280809_cov57-Attheya_sp.AAC.1
MDSSVPTPPPNIMPLCARPSSDATRKHKPIATRTRPTPPRNDHLIRILTSAANNDDADDANNDVNNDANNDENDYDNANNDANDNETSPLFR